MKCNNCGGSSIKIRKNYSHGARSKAVTSRVCKRCGSADIEYIDDSKKKRFGRR